VIAVVVAIAAAAIVAYWIGSAIDRRRRARKRIVDGQLAARRQMAVRSREPVLAPARVLPPAPGSVEAVLAHADAILKGRR